jgi:hypothetical protein
MEKIDNFLLSKFQKFSDFIQITFGITSFTISRMILIIWGFMFILRNMIEFDENGIKIDPSIISIPVVLLISFFIWSEIAKAERENKNSPQFKNFLHVGNYFARCVSLVFMPIAITIFILSLKDISSLKGFGIYLYAKVSLWEIIAYFLLVYFISLTPKPPQKSKFKKLVERLTTLTPEIKTQTV